MPCSTTCDPLLHDISDGASQTRISSTPPSSVGRRKSPPTVAVTKSRPPSSVSATEPMRRCAGCRRNHEGVVIVGCRPFDVDAILVRVRLCVRQGDNDATVTMLEVSHVGHFKAQIDSRCSVVVVSSSFL